MPLIVRMLLFVGRHWKAVALAVGLIAAGKFLPWEAVAQALATAWRFKWTLATCIGLLFVAHIYFRDRTPRNESASTSIQQTSIKWGDFPTAGLAMRLMYISVLTAFLIVSGFMILENQELRKVIPPSPIFYLSTLLGQALILISVNAFMGTHGKTLTDVQTAIFIITTAILVCASVLSPHMFPQVTEIVHPPIWQPWADAKPIVAPDRRFLWGLVPAAILLGLAIYRLYLFGMRFGQRVIGEERDLGTS